MHTTHTAIGQCNWRKGELQNPRVSFIQNSPRALTPQDWRNAMHAAGLSGSACSVALSPSILNHHVLQLPEMGSAELSEAVAWELADRLDRKRESLQIDAKRLGGGGDVLGVSIDQSTLSGILDPLYAAGLRPTIVEPSSFALARILSMRHRRNADRLTVRAVLDFSHDNSAMMVLAGDAIVFYKSLQYTGCSLVGAVSSHVGVNETQAIRMLKANDEEDETIVRAVRDATRSLHEQIARDVMKCLRHYGVTSRGPIPSELLVTGSTGWNKNLSEILETACNLTVYPDSNLEYLQNVKRTPECFGWQSALGTSLSHSSSNDRRTQTASVGVAA
ncbi:MAG: hypothetical protein QGI78_00280 [Phycisphaerales bacterium]|nr:hypothetical protein [Phycisphaerales bacterium]